MLPLQQTPQPIINIMRPAITALTSLFVLLITHYAIAAGPNVLLVITDDQGYGDIGFHGNTEIQTPGIDALARSSLRLTNFHVDPTCAETRAALMTGRYPLRGGVWHTVMGRSILRKEAVTMPQLFQAAGYRTGMFGKWHLGDNYPYRPQDRGFETTLHHGGGGVAQTPDVWGNDYFDDTYWSRDQLKPVRGYCTDVFFSAAREFIDSSSDKPFFCYVATNAPHSPYNVAPAYKKPYLDKGIEEPRASFYGMISNIDENLTRLLKHLDDRGLAENTIVIFMTDNGSAAGYVPANGKAPAKGFNAGMRAVKGSQYDGGHHTPCFIRYAKQLPTDRDATGLCAHMDLLPTLARLCDLKNEPSNKFDGVDLVDAVNQKQPWPERTLVVQSHRVEEPVKLRKSAVMTDRWRLVDGQELFDIHADPGQSKPVPATANADMIKQLRDKYDAWWNDMHVDPTQFSNISLGAEQAPRVRLTAHDWHGPQPIAYQDGIEKDPATNGFWAVDVARPGVYQFLLSRRPLDAPAPIGATSARVAIAGQSATCVLDPNVVVAPLTLRLPAGLTRLMTELTSADGSQRGAYFVTVNYLGDLPESQLTTANEGLPDWLHAGDRVAWLGGTLIERAAASGALETELLLRAPLSGLTFVNLGWSGDDFTGRARAVFGGPPEGKARRLADTTLSGSSLVVIAYGMSELLDGELTAERSTLYGSALRELVANLKQDGRRSVIALPPDLIDDIEGTAAQPAYAAICKAYQQRRPAMLTMLRSIAEELKLPVIELAAVRTSLLESGTYLSMSGYRTWAGSVADKMFKDVSTPVRSRTHEAELYQLASDGQRLFFDMHRPQNETYLLLFRKHEQGNNAVELGQYRALLADKQLELLLRAAAQ